MFNLYQIELIYMCKVRTKSGEWEFIGAFKTISNCLHFIEKIKKKQGKQMSNKLTGFENQRSRKNIK